MMCKDCRMTVKQRFHSVCAANRRTGWAVTLRNGLPVAVLALGASLSVAQNTPVSSNDIQTPVAVRMWQTAVVLEDRVRLEEIAQVSSGEDATVAAVRACPIVAAPPPGGSTIITLSDVTKAMAASGINPTRVLIRGAARCQVSRPADVPRRTPPATQPAAVAAKGDSPTSRPVADAPAVPGTLEEAVRNFLEAKLANLGGSVQVRFGPAARKALSLSSPAYTFRVRQRDGENMGLVALEVDVLENGQVADTVPIVCEVAILKSVVVARTPINRGELIEAKHLMLMERRFVRISEIGVTELQPVIGQECTRFVERGGMLAVRDVKARSLVKRGDLVTVWARNGDLVVKSVAKALGAGTYGESIQAKNEATGEIFPITITGPQTAEAGERATPSLAARTENAK